VTCERLVDGSEFADRPELTTIPAFQVDAVVAAPRGAWPASCAGYYGVDEAYLAHYHRAASASPDELQSFLAEHVLNAQPETAPAGVGE
jgi:glutaconate CoA-transferase subunit A